MPKPLANGYHYDYKFDPLEQLNSDWW